MIISMLYVVDDKMNGLCENFECGYDGMLGMVLKNRLNYWMLVMHFVIFELELCLLLWLCFKMECVNEDCVLMMIFCMLWVDLVVFFYSMNYEWI